MVFADTLFRFANVGVLLVMMLLILRDGWGIRALRFAFLLSASLAALFLSVTVSDDPSLRIGEPFRLALRLIDMCSVVYIWWLGLALFDDEFRLGPREWTVFAVYSTCQLPFRLSEAGVFVAVPRGVLGIVVDALSVVLMAHLLYLAVWGRNDDLIEGRRRIRVWFALAVGLAGASSILIEDFVSDAANLRFVSYVTLPLALWGVLWMSRLRPEALLFEPPSQTAVAPPKLALDPKDKALHARLIEVMEVERAFTEQGLTIGALAARVGAPEHHLRALINRSMGHRNFSSFLNAHRIAYAKSVLSDPAAARTPVLTIAMDAGYASLAPFNRAFRLLEGRTPSDFRAAALRSGDQN